MVAVEVGACGLACGAVKVIKRGHICAGLC